ncbi:PREDICTED: translational activator GCN1 [Colobus angolensis palliatus]|uniref:translational activator GCN1 n=1 Tax=Colobus angolensis palliatus TaxID=336983 RepID=UPI0005F5046F|nr:PREDICTED: translational activator GCN1 [Colobus angolensis palliatus]
MAADTQVSETLKRFAGKVTTASVKERREILSELGKCVAGKDLPEGAVKGLCKLFCLTLHRYRDAASRRALQAAIQQLAEAQPEATAKNLLHSLQSCGIGSKAGVPSKSSGSAALLALTWTCLLVRIVFPSRAKRQGDIWNKLVEVQCLLLLEVLGGSHKHAVDGAVKKLTKLWKENPGLVEQYLSAILSLEPNQNYAGMLGLLVQFCTSHKEMDVVSRHKSALLDFYMKNILMSKVKPPKYLLDSCAPLLRYLSHSEFKDLILPTIQKSLLRSPENVIETISSLLASVTLDLSQYAMDIVKGLAGHLKSNSPRLMDEAVLALRNLARQCSDSSAMESLTKHLFAILGGSEGKLTVIAQKMSVLSGIGSVSHHVVSGPSSQVLNGIVAELFIPFLQQEVHEGTLVHAVSVLALWCNRFTTEVPKKLTEWFKKAFSLKTSTSAVRHAYLQCMLASYRGDTLLQALDLLPLLIQTVEKAASQSTQVPTVTEGVAAALLLLKLSVADSQAEAKLSSFWQLIVDEKKQVFTSEKFLLMASEDALCTVLHLTERLFLDHPHRLTGNKVQQYHRALVAVLLSRTWHVRRQAQQTVRKLLSSLGGFKLAHGLLEELKTVLSSHKVLPLEALVTDAGEVTEAGKAYVPPRVLQEALCVISGVPGLKGDVTDTEQLAQEMLIISHHPSLVAVQSGLWPALLARMKIDPEAFITRHLDQIIPRITTQSPLNQSSMNAMGSLSILSPDRVLPQLISTITASVQNPALRLVTREEFAIMQTPAGELYDKSIIQSAQQDSIKKANMKRENKAYSFKEQIIELELKEEIKKKKGIKEEVQLTSKQKEMLQAQLDREAQVRRRLQELDGELEAALGLLDIILVKNPSGLTQYIPVLVDSFLPLLKSPLAAPRIKNPFLSLAACVMPSRLKALGTLVSHVTLRLLKPECVLDKSWCQEELSVAVKRAVTLLHTHTITSRVGKGEPGAAPLSAPAFSLVFPFLKMVLTEMSHHSEEEEERMAQILQILTVHAQLRASPSTPPGRVDENGPELLPRVAMLRLLTWVIGTGSPRLQVLASDTLTTLCASSSGDDGCAFAEQEEVDVLLCALQSPCASVRETVLRGLMELHMILPAPDTDEKNGLNLLRRLWVVKFDKEEEIRKLAERLWSMMGLDLQPDLCSLLIDDVIYHEAAVRQAGAEALSQAVARYQRQAAEVMGRLMEIYQEKLYRPPPVLDALGRVISESPPDQWEARCGLALALNKLSQYLDSSQVKPLFQFFVPDALNDRHPDVRKCMLDAALATLNTHGKENVNSLLPVFEEFLKNAPNDASYDAVRQSVVVLMGSLAKHLDKSDPKVKPIVAKLIAALSTPSQQVQESVASCLPPLVPAIKEDAGGMIQRLMQQLLESDKYAERKGAAYGLAGLVKGLGILSLKQQEMMAALTDAIQDKKNFRRREVLGLCLLSTGSVELLGAMAYCAPKQLSSCLPNIVPKLTEVLTDSHVKVQKAGQQALRQIGSVIRNPEILAIAPVLLDALTDPSRKTQKCLQTLLDTKFVHFIDAPSLALIMPIVQRAFQDRSTDTRKMAAQIIGNMYSLTDQKDLAPYLPSVTPGLKASLLDPVPEVRTVSAKALGAMVKGMGESCFEDLLPWLMETLTYEQSSVDRSGAAQGLAEVMAGLGVEKLEKLMPEIVATASKVDIAPHVRDGYIMMFNYLPITFGDKFTPYVGPIIPCILKALADENEFVRDTALRAGQRVISMYAETAIALLLPQLEQGLFDDLWRIRFSSVQLLGDLLFHISGVTGKMTTETASEDDNFGTAQSNKAIITALGVERRNRVLAGLYMGRSDTQLVVRQASLHVWKIVVSNTPRTLREILPTLFGLLLGFLASTCADKRTIAARTLGDLVRKLGEKILPEIIPILEEGLRSQKSDERQGVCIGLSEIMKSTSRDAVIYSLEAVLRGLYILSLFPGFLQKLDAGNQLALIEELHKEIRLIGNESKGEHVPGFCLPKKGVTSILPVLREGVLTGSPEQKEEAAKALGLVIRLTSADALRPSVVSITGPLIRILGDRFSWNVKAALLETLSLLLAKVGIALKPFLPQLQTTFTKALQDSNRGVRLKAADALGKLISIHIKVDPLFTELLNGIRAMEDPGVRDTMLQALRFVIQGAGAKVDAAIRKNIVSLLLSMLGHDEDNTRISSAGCLGELCAFLTEEELSAVLQQCLLADVSGIDWMVRHGRSLALSVAVNVAPGRLCAGRYSSDVQEMILSSATADRIPIAVSGVRGMGFLMRYHTETGGGQLPAKLSSLFVKCLQNPSSDIRLVAEKMIWWANKDPLPPLDPQVIKPILKALLDNTKDKNTVVRAYSDQAIVNLLKMRQGEEVFQSLSKILDVASLEVLNEVNRRSLKKLASQADSMEQVDDTILT